MAVGLTAGLSCSPRSGGIGAPFEVDGSMDSLGCTQIEIPARLPAPSVCPGLRSMASPQGTLLPPLIHTQGPLLRAASWGREPRDISLPGELAR